MTRDITPGTPVRPRRRYHIGQALIVSGMLLWLPGLAKADELNNPHSAVFDVGCDLDGNGSLETTFPALDLRQ